MQFGAQGPAVDYQVLTPTPPLFPDSSSAEVECPPQSGSPRGVGGGCILMHSYLLGGIVSPPPLTLIRALFILLPRTCSGLQFLIDFSPCEAVRISCENQFTPAPIRTSVAPCLLASSRQILTWWFLIILSAFDVSSEIILCCNLHFFFLLVSVEGNVYDLDHHCCKRRSLPLPDSLCVSNVSYHFFTFCICIVLIKGEL